MKETPKKNKSNYIEAKPIPGLPYRFWCMPITESAGRSEVTPEDLEAVRQYEERRQERLKKYQAEQEKKKKEQERKEELEKKFSD